MLVSLEGSFLQEPGGWEPALSGGSCGARQVMGDTWAQPGAGRGRAIPQTACRGASSSINGRKILFHPFYLFFWSTGWLAGAVEAADQVGNIKTCVLCTGAVLLGRGFCLAEVIAVFLGLCWWLPCAFPKEGGREGGRVAQVLSLVLILPSVRPRFGVV